MASWSGLRVGSPRAIGRERGSLIRGVNSLNISLSNLNSEDGHHLMHGAFNAPPALPEEDAGCDLSMHRNFHNCTVKPQLPLVEVGLDL